MHSTGESPQVQSCPHCGEKAVYGWEKECRACRSFIGFPNVRRAEQEREVLEDRYTTALDGARQRHANRPLSDLMELVAAAEAVVTTDLGFARQFFESEDALYAPYFNLVRAGIRSPAFPQHDTRRRAIDASVYASYGDSITFGVLSITGVGPHSYGSVHLQLAPRAIARRATLAEKNVFFLVKERVAATGDQLPPGHLALWDERVKLAVVKLAERLTPETASESLHAMIMSSDGDRQTDDFLEVHIFDGFNHQAVASVSVWPTPLSPHDEYDADHLSYLTSLRGIQWSNKSTSHG